MPSTVRSLFKAASLRWAGVVRWDESLPSRSPGVYVVALVPRVDRVEGCLSECPLSMAAVRELLNVRSELTLDDGRPTAQALAARVGSFWLPDEVVLYVGKTTEPLHKRVGDYYRTKIGARSPHAGGRFLRLLTDLEQLHVHYAETDDPKRGESRMLRAFQERVSRQGRQAYYDQNLLLPFANMEWDYEVDGNWSKVRRRHGISGDTG